MDKKKLLEPTALESPAGKKLMTLMTSAEEALAKADAQELFELFQQAIQERGQALNTMGLVASHYLGEKGQPRYVPTDNAVESMERVALAAIDLAKSTITKSK